MSPICIYIFIESIRDPGAVITQMAVITRHMINYWLILKPDLWSASVELTSGITLGPKRGVRGCAGHRGELCGAGAAIPIHNNN